MLTTHVPWLSAHILKVNEPSVLHTIYGYDHRVLFISRVQPCSQTPIIYWTLLSSTTASLIMRHCTLIATSVLGITDKKGRIIACHQQGSTDTGVPVPVPSVPMELPVSWPQWSAFLSTTDRVIVTCTPNPCWVWSNIGTVRVNFPINALHPHSSAWSWPMHSG